MSRRRHQGTSAVDLTGEHDWIVRDWDDDGPREELAIIDGGRGGVVVYDDPNTTESAHAGDNWIAGDEALLSACGTSSGWPLGVGDAWRRIRLVDALISASEMNDRPVLAAARALAGEVARLVFVADLHDQRLRMQAERLKSLFPRLIIVERREAIRAYLDDGEPSTLLVVLRGTMTLFPPDDGSGRTWPWPGTAMNRAASRLGLLSQESGENEDLLRRGARSIWASGETAPLGGDAIRLKNGDYRILPEIAWCLGTTPALPAEAADALGGLTRSCAVWSPCAAVGDALATTLTRALRGRAPDLLPAHAAALGAMRLVKSRR